MIRRAGWKAGHETGFERRTADREPGRRWKAPQSEPGRSLPRSWALAARPDRRAPARCTRTRCRRWPRVDQARTSWPPRQGRARRLGAPDDRDPLLPDDRDRARRVHDGDPDDRARRTRGRAETTPRTSTGPGP